jgi:preprotein translocase subunit SecG
LARCAEARFTPIVEFEEFILSYLLSIILTVQIITAVAMIVLILIQHGKGADMGAAFGSGSSGSLFGASGSANFLSRTTAILATVFFVATMALAFFGNTVTRPAASGSVLEGAAATIPAGAASAPVSVPVGIPSPATSAPASAPVGAAQIPTK